MENGHMSHIWFIYPLDMVIFHSYVELPEDRLCMTMLLSFGAYYIFFGTHEHMTTHHEGHRYGPRAKGRTWSHHLLAEEHPESMKNHICL